MDDDKTYVDEDVPNVDLSYNDEMEMDTPTLMSRRTR